MVRKTKTKAKSKGKNKRFSLVLSERDVRKLSLYARDHGISRPMALRRMVREVLQAYTPSPSVTVDERQLSIFDSIQTDIFNNTSKT